MVSCCQTQRRGSLPQVLLFAPLEGSMMSRATLHGQQSQNPQYVSPSTFAAGDIVAVGDGKVGDTIQTFDLSVGETILYSKFGIGATDISVRGALHVLIREDDVIGTLPRSGATAADVPDLKPAADRVLIKVAPLLHPLCEACGV